MFQSKKIQNEKEIAKTDFDESFFFKFKKHSIEKSQKKILAQIWCQPMKIK